MIEAIGSFEKRWRVRTGPRFNGYCFPGAARCVRRTLTAANMLTVPRAGPVSVNGARTCAMRANPVLLSVPATARQVSGYLAHYIGHWGCGNNYDGKILKIVRRNSHLGPRWIIECRITSPMRALLIQVMAWCHLVCRLFGPKSLSERVLAYW